MGRLLDIIIPTWNNPDFLNPCVESIITTGILRDIARLIIVNNGSQDIRTLVKQIPNITVLEPGENLGWERGLECGLKHSDAPFVVFQNDDTHIPVANHDFYLKLLHPFHDDNVAAVGPATTVAAGWHSIFHHQLKAPHVVPYLIFFTVAVRREHLDAVGGIDATCPGGDDLDLSMRFRMAGRKLIVNPHAFLVHHGFKSGTRLRGDHNVKGGWNSTEMQEETTRWLIQKHGFKNYVATVQSGIAPAITMMDTRDLEGDAVRKFVTGKKIVELGCGFRKTVPNAVGVDRCLVGESIPHVPGETCVADIEADVTEPLPFEDFSKDTIIARHILEHCIDSVGTLAHWNRILRIGGRLIIAVPNDEIQKGIPLNPEHVHAFTPSSLMNLAEAVGFRHIETTDPQNGVSLVACFEKILHMAPTKMEALVNA